MAEIGINLPGLVTQLVSFLILFYILSKLLYGPISRALDGRTDRIRESLEAADRARQDAASSAERVEQEIAAARTQGQQLIAEARDAAGRLRVTEEERVRADLETLRERAAQDVRRERDAAIEEIRAEFANLAVDAAERVIGRSLDAQAHREIIEGVLQEGLAGNRGN
ncbi:MAG: F0F1 ATP synthase subunit B [Chloroflexi bacterium]|nr:F0F1 ATP synthase subunit B [Chloroflexota bacterium]